jgi:type VI secretion system ImpM family protein
MACFGKLPFWREYLKGGAVHPTSRALRDWLHKGKEALGLENGEEGVKDEVFNARLRVLLGLPGSKELLAGVIRPSNDAGGRHFPFAVFTHFPRKVYGKHYSLLPLALVPAWEALDDAWDALAGVASREAFEEVLASNEAPGLVPAAEARGEYQGRQREDAAHVFANDPPSSPQALRAGMPGLLSGLRKSSVGGGLNVQLPAAPDLEEACFNASLWIEMVNRQFRLRRYEPSVLIDAKVNSVPRRVFLKFGPIEPGDYIDIMGVLGRGSDLRPVTRNPLWARMNGERPTAAFEENLLTWVAGETDNQPIVTLRK